MARRRFRKNPVADDILGPVILIGLGLVVWFEWPKIAALFSGTPAAPGGGMPPGATTNFGTPNNPLGNVAGEQGVVGTAGGGFTQVNRAFNPMTGTGQSFDQGMTFPGPGGTAPIGGAAGGGVPNMPPLADFTGF